MLQKFPLKGQVAITASQGASGACSNTRKGPTPHSKEVLGSEAQLLPGWEGGQVTARGPQGTPQGGAGEGEQKHPGVSAWPWLCIVSCDSKS